MICLNKYITTLNIVHRLTGYVTWHSTFGSNNGNWYNSSKWNYDKRNTDWDPV